MGGGGVRANNYVLDGFPVTDLQNRSSTNPSGEMVEHKSSRCRRRATRLGHRDEPTGRVPVWQREAWIPGRRVSGDETDAMWEYPIATPLRPVSEPWHDGDPKADAFWGPSVHWNTYLGRYVKLLNRAKNESFDNEGIYVSYTRDLADPTGRSVSQKLMNGGGWYP